MTLAAPVVVRLPALTPRNTLLLAVLTHSPARNPIPIFSEPVVVPLPCNADLPKAILLLLVPVLSQPAYCPMNILQFPVVVALPALTPNATL